MLLKCKTQKRKEINNKILWFTDQPSGISSEITASSAIIHKQVLTKRGYSSLQSSARCLPVRDSAVSADSVYRNQGKISVKTTCFHSKVGG
jgi:hypothetical protein